MAEFGGVDLQDLILPGLLGVLGSWNRDTGRGVALGIEGYQQLQAAQQAKKFSEAYKRIYDPRVAQIQQELTGLDEAGNAVDLNETAYSGFHRQYGPKLASPKPDLYPQRRFSDLYSTEPANVLGIDRDRHMDLGIAPDMFDRRPEEGQPTAPGLQLGVQDTISEIPFPEDDADWAQIKDPTEVASRREKLENELRFLQVSEVLSGVNPSSAGWAMTQWEQGERGQINDLDRMAEQLMANEYDREGRERVELNLMQAKAGHTTAKLNLQDWYARLEHTRAMARRPDYTGQPWGSLNVDTGERWEAPPRSRSAGTTAPKPAQLRGEFIQRSNTYEQNKGMTDPQTLHNYWVILKQSFDALVEGGISTGLVMPPEPPDPSQTLPDPNQNQSPWPEQPGSLNSELGLGGAAGKFGT